MKKGDFENYTGLLTDCVVQLFPLPKGFKSDDNNFTFVGLSQTHLKLKQQSSDQELLVPLALIEFVNPGVVRMTRETESFDESFV